MPLNYTNNSLIHYILNAKKNDTPVCCNLICIKQVSKYSLKSESTIIKICYAKFNLLYLKGFERVPYFCLITKLYIIKGDETPKLSLHYFKHIITGFCIN